MPEAYAALASLRKMLVKEREDTKEILAGGRGEEKHWELVGRAKALEWVIDKVAQQIKQVNGGDGDAET